jgi:hypothetical protein
VAKLPNGPGQGNVANPGNVAYRGDLPAPVTTYASAAANLPMRARLNVPPSTNLDGSAVVNRVERRAGHRYWYSHGGVTMPMPGVPRPGAGGVFSSSFQQTLVQLHDWMINLEWYAAGYPRNMGYSFRAQQVQTRTTGGPTAAAMQQRPLFPKVQTIKRYTVATPRYPTRSTKG